MNNPLYYPTNVPPTKICQKAEDGRHQFTHPNIECDWCGFGGVIVNGEVLYVPTEKGREYHMATQPNVLFWGGRGSAKSTTGRWDAHLRALAHPGYRYVVLRRNFPELEKSHLVHIHKEMSALGGYYNSTFHKAYYPNGSIGFFSHCSTDKDVLNLLSTEFALAFFDEISTFEWEQFVKLAASVRVPVGSGLTAMVRAATNPLGPSAQKLLQYFVEHNVDHDEDPDYNPNDWYSIKANLEDNPYLDQVQYRKRFSGLPSHVRKAWVDGEFQLENALFDLRPNIEGKSYHVIHDIDLPKVIQSATIYRALDAGWFPDPTVCLWIAHLGNRHIVFHEKTWYKTTAAEVAADILEEDRRLGIPRVAITYCDPSIDINTTADIKTIRERYEESGIPMECSINKRDWFAGAIHNALAEEAGEFLPRIQFYVSGRAGCPMLVRTLPQMRYDDKLGRENMMADHKDDHWVVALAYYLLSHSSDPHRLGGMEVLTKPRPWMKPKKGERFVLGKDNVRERAR